MILGKTVGQIKVPVIVGVAVALLAFPWRVVAAPARLTLADALELAMEHNPELSSSKLALELGRSKLRESGGSQQPRLYVQGSYYDTQTRFPSGVSTSDRPPSMSVTASQTLPNVLPWPFGVGLSPLELAAVDLESSELDLERTRQKAIFDVISAYLNVLKAEQMKALSDSALEGAAVFLDEVRVKVSLGIATQLDLMKAQGQCDQTRFSRIKAEDDLGSAMRSLALLLGLPAEEKFELVDDFHVEPDEHDIEALVASALENREEVKQSGLSLRKARAAVETARRSLYPSVILSAKHSSQEEISLSGTASANLTSGDVGWKLELGNEPSSDFRPEAGSTPSSSSTLGIEVTWPLWDGGVARERLRQAEMNLRMQESALERQKQAITEDVYAAAVGLKQALLRFQLAEDELAQAEEALRIAEARFDAGVGVAAEVIDASQSLASARYGTVGALFDCYLAQARLARAVGLLGIEGWTR